MLQCTRGGEEDVDREVLGPGGSMTFCNVSRYLRGQGEEEGPTKVL